MAFCIISLYAADVSFSASFYNHNDDHTIPHFHHECLSLRSVLSLLFLLIASARIWQRLKVVTGKWFLLTSFLALRLAEVNGREEEEEDKEEEGEEEEEEEKELEE